ncbi:hypothetical protein AGMMS50268_02850 [Spirochaetia bacterium]|nr:hypothetical protein AGMMS50268_02850 [Spirochaetia bacterium]
MRINVSDLPGLRSPGQIRSAGSRGAEKSPDKAGAGAPAAPGNGSVSGAAGPVRQTRPPQLPVDPSQLFTKLGLPNDKLSASIAAFARYFSLPLEPALLGKIRRQALNADAGKAAAVKTAASAVPVKTPTAAEALSLKTREALSLAALAAADKGVELSRDSLADYARSLSRSLAIDPDKRRSGGGHGDGGGFGTGADKGNAGEAGGGTAGETGGNGAGNGNGSPNKQGERDKNPGDGGALREKILQTEEQNPLISLMNRLPGKKGQRWIVLPFFFGNQDRNFAVTLRILLTPELAAAVPTKGRISPPGALAGASGFRAERMALEIAGEKQHPNQSPSHWLFILENPPGGELRLRGSLGTGASPPEKTTAKVLRAIEKELAALLGIAPEQVQMKDEGEFPPFADSRNEALLSINEEV